MPGDNGYQHDILVIGGGGAGLRAAIAAVARALEAGAKPVMPITDMFWGDRIGGIEDPYGQKWTLATHTEDVAPREMGKRAQAFYAQMSGSR